ncbi:Hypothetical protein FKW44_008475 [Caligus rogercresseyi]|uniref:Uncharacterized protein n=1 Tax=Caligus rogercresseyi TaxID=217165 RepID=A0A7T8KGC2_CALRO|nr:Hypothetical protein FKW44_008475 [Caligus rogercresseyi]
MTAFRLRKGGHPRVDEDGLQKGRSHLYHGLTSDVKEGPIDHRQKGGEGRPSSFICTFFFWR